ncbi:MAG: methionine ABC transporter ATP-binding protein [Peptoniphilaceae bacterium]|nr:methionine ABC transporter ATP-binding protein [Peptoniphilaceae bacterium]MDY6085684.1 methionine ABC transporter ATP-binding protein [Peptoniphilaceae bacterium]
MISLEHISVDFDQVHAVRDVSLKIRDGDVFGIVGYSGAGKSTLVRTINLLQRPTSGRVVIDDTNLLELSPKKLRERRKQIGMIFQSFNLLGARTVLENVIYPIRHEPLTRAEKEKRARELLDLVGIAQKADAYPSQLSGGQQQRCAIARALASQPDILLCDEATSALDPKTTKQILQLLRKVNETLGITIVLITHEMRAVKEICNRCAVMQDGRVVEEADTIELFVRPKTALAQDFVATSSETANTVEKILNGAIALDPDAELAQLRYVGDSATEPLIAQLYSEFGVVTNILAGSIELIANTPVGQLVVSLKGTRDAVRQALDALQQSGVQVQRLFPRTNGPNGETPAHTPTTPLTANERSAHGF